MLGVSSRSALDATLRGHRLAWFTSLAIALLALLTFAYRSASPHSYSATTRIAVFTGGPNSLIPSTPVMGRQLDPYLLTLRSVYVAEAVVQRLPGPPPPNRKSFLKASTELARRVKVGLASNSSALEVTATATSPEQAAIVANAFAGGLLQVLGAQARNITHRAVTEALERALRLPRNGGARSTGLAALRRQLEPVLAERQIEIVQPASPASAPLLAMVVTAAIAVVAILALLMLTGVWRPRPRSLET